MPGKVHVQLNSATPSLVPPRKGHWHTGTAPSRFSACPWGVRGWWQISGLFACREDGYAQTCLGPSFLTDPQQKHGWDQTCVAQTVLKPFSTAPRKCLLEKRGPKVRSSALCWKSSPAAQQYRCEQKEGSSPYTSQKHIPVSTSLIQP